MREDAAIAIVIEDDPVAADALGLLLADWGVEAITGADSGAILQALWDPVHKPVRWIIADYDLGPGPTGVAVAQDLSHQLPGARVLVLTGAPPGRVDQDAKDAGYEVMRKPASARAIIDWLDGRSRATRVAK